MPGDIDLGLGDVLKRPQEAILKPGDCILVAEWSWNLRKFGWTRKLVCLDEKGDVSVRPL